VPRVSHASGWSSGPVAIAACTYVSYWGVGPAIAVPAALTAWPPAFLVVEWS